MAGSRNSDNGPHIAFAFVGGMHQALHIAPVAATLQAGGTARVEAFVVDAEAGAALADMFAGLGAPGIPIHIMTLPRWIDRPAAASKRFKAMKLPRLLFWQRALRRFDAIVTAERTTTLLKRLPGRQPLMVHIPHGAGDRAKGFERRLKLFDLVITAGEKDRRRMIREGCIRPEDSASSGYIKLAGVLRLAPVPDVEPLDPARPTVLYNPHFAPGLSSWHRLGEALVDGIIADGRYNLIVAPHVRLRESLSPETIAAWSRKAGPGRVTIDFGSPRSFDMSYTRAADIYIGDVSSQVYEYLVTPKPCLFLDAHATAWAGNPDYAMWRFGAVCGSLEDAMVGIERAEARHGEFVDIQRAARSEALGDSGAEAPNIAARLIMKRLKARQSSPSLQGRG